MEIKTPRLEVGPVKGEVITSGLGRTGDEKRSTSTARDLSAHSQHEAGRLSCPHIQQGSWHASAH